MKYVEFVRVDERLVHGQILTKWIEYTKCDEVIVLDDNICNDPIMKSVMKMSFPKNISLEVYSIKTGVKTILEKKEKDVKILLLMKNLTVLKNAFDAGLCFDTVNIARLPFSPGKIKLLNNIYMSDCDIRILKKFLEDNIKFIVQMVPDSEAVDLKEISFNEK